ncbi:MAG: glutathione S-transferase [Rhodospirillaceae bacterium]|nr:glutathione S-transferase [Alphaproteobacteria bacterium]MBR73173.1 glutathione S-transferase [Rhodospirillaceae bacterium]|tara:strand:- start:1714 stop:2418 length:705 start_codon:yes stop_codon:yes gene_type:complete
MIDLYYWPTPNGWKITILFEELGLEYKIVPVNILNGDQFEPDFLKIAPNNKMPAIIDSNGPNGESISIFESGAILLHYAEQEDKFIPSDKRGRMEVLQWLFFQMAHVGPMLGQNHHFRVYAPEKIQYAIDRYTKEASRIYGVIDKCLSKQEFIAGDYSIADMAIYPWIRGYERQGQDLETFPNLKRWYLEIEKRPGVQRGLDVLKDLRKNPGDFTEDQRSIMFGDKQFERGINR